MKLTRIVTLALALTALTTAPTAAQTGHDLFQQALVKEQAEGDLRAAIALYERIVREFAGDRALAANALVQMGQCYERLGSQEAERAYQRVVRDYPDQTEIVTRARARLAALRQPPREAAEPTIVVRQLPAIPGFSDGFADGGPLPDGRGFVFVDYATGDLALMDLVTGETRRLTHEGRWEPPEQYAVNAAVSPDGRRVAYTWSRRDSVIELRVVGMDGSAPRVLTSNTDGVGYPMSWSTDGRHLAFPVYHAADRTGAIAWLSLDEGSIRELAALPSWAWVTLSHSPDDAYVAMEFPVDADSGRYDIFLVATDGSGMVPLVNHPADERLVGWLPGTDQILFLSDRSGPWDAWAVPVKDGQPSGEPRIVKRSMGEVDPVGFAADGSLFYALYHRRYTTSLAPFDASTGQIDMSAAEPLRGSLVAPSWTPDAKRLVLLSDESTRAGQPKLTVAIHDLATGEKRVLAEQLDPDKPVWSPDGQSILVAARERAQPWGGAALYRIDGATGEARTLIEVPADSSWRGLGNSYHMGLGGVLTPDGETLAYVQSGRLVRRQLASGAETELYHDPGIATRLLALTPDGTELAFAINDSLDAAWPHPLTRLQGAGKLMIVPVEGGAVRELARVPGPGTLNNIQWAPDGRSLLFVQDRGRAGSTLWRVAREGGDLQATWQTSRNLMVVTFSPDGTRVAFTTFETGSEAWVMKNLVEALKRVQER